MCGRLTKSRHLNEIEGEGFQVDEQEVERIRRELEDSKKRGTAIPAHADILIIYLKYF